eukprot:Skav224047  [mRNA]  locus=scaffold534:28174:29184:- [translate_table: standard]
MSWHCSHCNLSNSPQADTCRKCHKGWQEVWIPRKDRSKSRQRRPKEKREKPSKGAPSTPKQPLDIFSEKLPWVSSTPQSRLVQPGMEASPSGESGLPLPPAPSLPPPPKVDDEQVMMTAEEQKTLEHLRGLRDQLELPPQLLAVCNELESKARAVVPKISHAHINRMNKLQNQVTSAMKKVSQLDSEWDGFMHTVTERVQNHIMMYRQRRLEYIENYKAKLKEMKQLRLELAQASQEMCASLPPAHIKEEMPDPNFFFQRIQEMASQVRESGPISVDDSPEMIAEEMEEEQEADEESPKEKKDKKQPVKAATFRHAGSPTKVATNILKPAKDGKTA